MFSPISGNTSSCIKFGIKSIVEITSFEKFVEFLKNNQATSSVNADQTTIIQFGKPEFNSVETISTFTVGQESVKIELYHKSYNYGIQASQKKVLINLNGSETSIPISFFTKEQLANAFNL